MENQPYKDILLVEDEPDLGQVLSQYFQFKGITLSWCTSAAQAIISMQSNTFGLAIIDVNLPDQSGFELAKVLKDINGQQAFVFLTAKQQPEDRLLGLELGAIDYVGKPFVMQELMLKIQNMLQLNKPSIVPEDEHLSMQLGKITFFPNQLSLLLDNGKKERLTKREAAILRHLLTRRNHLVQRNDLLLQYWGDTDYFNGKSLEVFISRIRKLLKAENRIKIESIYGAGYILTFQEV